MRWCLTCEVGWVGAGRCWVCDGEGGHVPPWPRVQVPLEQRRRDVVAIAAATGQAPPAWAVRDAG